MRFTHEDVLCECGHLRMHAAKVVCEIGNVPPLFHCFDEYFLHSIVCHAV